MNDQKVKECIVFFVCRAGMYPFNYNNVSDPLIIFFEKLMKQNKLKLDIPSCGNDLIEYLGYGEGETYIDAYRSADFGYYTTSPSEEYYSYVKPQESGSHYATRKVQISNQTNSIVIYGEVSFSYIPYSINELSKNEVSIVRLENEI